MALKSKAKVFKGATIQLSLDGTTWESAGQFKNFAGNEEVTDGVEVTNGESDHKEKVAGETDLGEISFKSVIEFSKIAALRTKYRGKNGVKVKFTLDDDDTDPSWIKHTGFISKFNPVGEGDNATGQNEASISLTLQDDPEYHESGVAA